MPELNIPIPQIIRNYTTNLPAFPPNEPGLAEFHRFLLGFYPKFQAAAQQRGIPEGDQPALLERVQKILWVFGRYGRLESTGTHLEAEGQALRQNLKFPRLEQTLALLGDLGAPVELRFNGEWERPGKRLPASRMQSCEAGRLHFAGESGAAVLRALPALVESILSRTPKEKMAYERFLRANPRAVLAREKPPLDLAADAPQILANLPPAPAAAWQELVRFLADFGGYSPSVEFRSIHHGMWVANYESRRGKTDLCGLIIENGEMAVRTILYGATHFQVKDMLDEFGDPVRAAFHQAHYYAEFEHQWLFIPCTGVADLPGIKKLLALQAEVLPKRK